MVYGFQANPPRGTLRGLVTWVSKLVLRSPMGAETAAKVSPFRVFRTQMRVIPVANESVAALLAIEAALLTRGVSLPFDTSLFAVATSSEETS